MPNSNGTNAQKHTLSIIYSINTRGCPSLAAIFLGQAVFTPPPHLNCDYFLEVSLEKAYIWLFAQIDKWGQQLCILVDPIKIFRFIKQKRPIHSEKVTFTPANSCHLKLGYFLEVSHKA